VGAVLTVVVPIYNVGRYLAECLDSVLGQTYADLDVVLVDDGSTDDSGGIAARYAAADPRVRLHRQANAGLGAARNAGIALGTGDYLTFVDSDDVLPTYALEVLVGALESTGSDFASGNVGLLTTRGVRQSPLHRGTHRRTRLRVTLAEQRNLVYDRLACNKVFRRSFWERHGLRFPEGVRYEDIPVTVPATALAGAIDLVELPVYHWRQREAGSEQSISQRQTEVTNLVDRFAAVADARRSLAAVDPKLAAWYDETALQSDLRMFLHLLPDVDRTWRERFVELAAGYLAGVDDAVLARLTPALRLSWTLARQRSTHELLTVVSATRGQSTPPVVRRGRGHYQLMPYLDAGRSDLPRSLYRVAGGLRTRVHEVRWCGGKLRLTGHAYAADLGAARPWSSLRTLWLREDTGPGRRVVLPSVPRRSPDPPADAGAYAWAGFRTTVDTSALAARDGWVPGTWTLRAASVGTGGLVKSRWVSVGEIPPPLPAAWVDTDVRVVPFVHDRALKLRVERVGARATGCHVDGDDLVLVGSLPGEPSTAASVRLCRVPGLPWRRYPVAFDDRRARPAAFTARIPLADLAGGQPATGGRLPGVVGDGWLVEFDAGDGEARPLPVAADFADLRGTGATAMLLVEPGDGGDLWVRAVPPGPVATGVGTAPGELVLAGVLPDGADPTGAAGFELVLRFRDEGPDRLPPADVPVPVELTAGGWRAGLRADAVGAGRLAGGYWWLLWRPTGGGAVDLPFSLRVREQLSTRWAGGRLRVEPDRHHRVVLRVAD
jgi:CDP-glycerol glycerophosphotransferase